MSHGVYQPTNITGPTLTGWFLFEGVLYSKPKETDVTPMTSQSGPVEAAGEASEALQL